MNNTLALWIGLFSLILSNPMAMQSSQPVVMSAFISTWHTNSSNQILTIPTTGTGYNYDVDWGDTTVGTGDDIVWFADVCYGVPVIVPIETPGPFPSGSSMLNTTFSGKF